MARARHIRKQLKPKGGNQWCKDNSERVSESLCGSNTTSDDIDIRTAKAKKHQEWALENVCKDCLGLLGQVV